MGGPIPTLGYPTRQAAVLALGAQKKSVEEICRLTGMTHENVATIISKARHDDNPTFGLRSPKARTVVFPIDVIERGLPHATARKISVNELFRRIVDAVIDEGLVTAVLDDEQPGANDGQ